jgi:hypothetical protein
MYHFYLHAPLHSNFPPALATWRRKGSRISQPGRIMKKNNVVKGIRKCFAFSLLRGPYYLLYVLTLGFMVCIFLLPDEETLKMLNIAFPVVAIVAGISFSWAQCLHNGVFKQKVLHASKRFFHSLILLFLTILLKYISFVPIPAVYRPKPLLVILDGLNFCTAGAALLFFYGGIHVISNYLWIDEGVEKGENGATMENPIGNSDPDPD